MNPNANRNILIAVDASENSRRAVEYVAKLLGGVKGFRVTVLHVVREPEEDEFANEGEKEKWYATYRTQVDPMLAEYRHILMDEKFAPEDVDTRSILRNCPSMGDCILAERELLGSATLVVGRQGISRKEEFLFGSVSGKIVRTARNCTVWVVE